MLLLFILWAWLCYVKAWHGLNIALAWFWWRHLDSGLHSACHGDFRYWRGGQRCLLSVYGLLSWHMRDYYARNVGMPKHMWHHLHTNDPKRDPDWQSMTGNAWVRRHHSVTWRPFHAWQHRYWLAVSLTLESLNELLNMMRSCIEAVSGLLEPPSPMDAPWTTRVLEAAALWFEVLVNPGYQGLAVILDRSWRSVAVLLVGRAVAKLVLYPFSEVQHYMPEHIPEPRLPASTPDAKRRRTTSECRSEWAVQQLHSTANLCVGRLFRAMDFLMFYGDTYQIEHHLWPAMTFAHLPRASQIVRAICKEHGVPYHSIGYWEGYRKIRSQVWTHRTQSAVEPESSSESES